MIYLRAKLSRYLVPLVIVCASTIFMFLVAPAHSRSYGPEVPPCPVSPHLIFITFLPFETPDASASLEDIRIGVNKLLEEKNDYRYHFSLSSIVQSKDIYEHGFVKTKDETKKPSTDYWNSYVGHLAFGGYAIDNDRLEVQFFLYDIQFSAGGPLIQKHYKLSTKDLPLLYANIAEDIILPV
jgi:hypothetical protein